MSDLKPCPFCGSETRTVKGPYIVGEVYSCSECGLRDLLFSPKSWNTRPTEDALRERIKVLEAVRDAAEGFDFDEDGEFIDSMDFYGRDVILFTALKAARSGE